MIEIVSKKQIRDILCEKHVNRSWYHTIVPSIQKVTDIERTSSLDIPPHSSKPIYAPPFERLALRASYSLSRQVVTLRVIGHLLALRCHVGV